MKNVLTKQAIFLNCTATNKEEAIKQAGAKMLELGYIKPDYVQSMLEREQLTTTFIGNNVAIPHGTNSGKEHVIKTGLVVLMYPQGVDFGEDNTVKMLVGIAAKGDEHLEVLQHLALLLIDEDKVANILASTDVDFLLNTLTAE